MRIGRNIPSYYELRTIYGDLIKKPNVSLCFIGKKRIKGEITSHTALICGVKKKVDKKALIAEEKIPPQVQWLSKSKHPRRIKTDVIEIESSFTFHQGCIIGPGDCAIRDDNSRATIGMALYHPSLGPVVTTAGHLFPQFVEDEIIDIQSGDQTVSGKLKRRVLNNRCDYALVEIEGQVPIQNLFRDRYAIGPLHYPEEEDLDQELKILIPGHQPPIHVTCQGIHGFLNEPGGPSLNDLILTDYATERGHSGSCLIGENGAVWGLLVGGTISQGMSYSAFLPAHRIISREKAELI